MDTIEVHKDSTVDLDKIVFASESEIDNKRVFIFSSKK